MRGLLTRELINAKSLIVVVLILIPLGYIVTLPPFMMSLGLMLPVVIISIFFADHRASINQFLISLPIKRNQLIISRYISISIIWIFTVLYQYIIGNLLKNFSPIYIYSFGWKEIIVLLSFGLLVIALFIPIYSMVSSFLFATIIVIILYFTTHFVTLDTLVNFSGMTTTIIFNDLDQWIIPLLEETIAFYPFLLLPIGALILYGVSLSLSILVISNKKII